MLVGEKFPDLFHRYGDLLSTQQIADYLSITPKTVCALIKQKKLKAKRVGREWRIPTYKLIEFIER